MSEQVEKEAKYSRQEVRDMLVGVAGKQTRLNTLHGLLWATTQLIVEESDPETADSYLLATRWRVLGRGSSSLDRGNS